MYRIAVPCCVTAATAVWCCCTAEISIGFRDNRQSSQQTNISLEGCFTVHLPHEIILNANLMQQGNFIGVFLARHVSGTYAHHQEHWMLSCSIWFSAPSFWMGGGARQHPHRTHDLRSGSQDHHPSKNSMQKTICWNSTSNAPDDGRIYPKHVELRMRQ